jgi:hypothetical protein
LPFHHLIPHITGHPFSVSSLKEKKYLHLDELISPKNAAEAIQTFIRRVTTSFG